MPCPRPVLNVPRAKSILDGLVKSLLKRHPGEPRIMSGAGAGVQKLSPRKRGTIKENLDSGFRRNDEFYGISTFYEIINAWNFLRFQDFIRNIIISYIYLIKQNFIYVKRFAYINT